MKKILSVIGGFFVAIWRWIKETAWVQPLLIVGIIFGIIFSIPSIVDGFQSISDNKNSADAYYKKFQVSLKGAENSAAQKLLNEIYDNENGQSTTLKDKKFFIVFVQGDGKCAACDSAKEGFEYLATYPKGLLGDKKLELKTIFVDEVLKGKDKEDWKKDSTDPIDNFAETAFEALLIRNALYFEEYAGAATETSFYLNGGITESQISDLESADVKKFQTPTTLLVDFTINAPVQGVTGAFIGIDAPETSKRGKADYLLNAWNYDGIFGENYSPN